MHVMQKLFLFSLNTLQLSYWFVFLFIQLIGKLSNFLTFIRMCCFQLASYWSSHFTVAFLCLFSAMQVCFSNEYSCISSLFYGSHFTLHTSSPPCLLHIRYHLRAELSLAILGVKNLVASYRPCPQKCFGGVYNSNVLSTICVLNSNYVHPYRLVSCLIPWSIVNLPDGLIG